MAEALPEAGRFFCHSCSAEINPRLPVRFKDAGCTSTPWSCSSCLKHSHVCGTIKNYRPRCKNANTVPELISSKLGHEGSQCIFHHTAHFCCICAIPDYTCPRCESGFIEELPEIRSTENSSNTSGTDQNRHPFEGLEATPFSLPPGYGQVTFGIFNEGLEFPIFSTSGTSEENREGETRREQQSRHRYSARQPRARLSTRRSTGRHEGVPTLEGIIQQLVNGIIAPTAMPNLGLGPWGVLHSNPMDYAWGANGLDTIITQLLNQFENTGPPPADNEKIQALPTVQITDEHVGSGLECPVCKEDYTVGENVRQLPCNHLFHNNCIIPWLEQHDTCPVCRKSLSGQNTATNPPGLTDLNYSASSASSSSSTSPTDENNSANNS